MSCYHHRCVGSGSSSTDVLSVAGSAISVRRRCRFLTNTMLFLLPSTSMLMLSFHVLPTTDGAASNYQDSSSPSSRYGGADNSRYYDTNDYNPNDDENESQQRQQQWDEADTSSASQQQDYPQQPYYSDDTYPYQQQEQQGQQPYYDQQQQQAGGGAVPPPPPPHLPQDTAAGTTSYTHQQQQYNPIHYQFPQQPYSDASPLSSSETAATAAAAEDDGVPRTVSVEEENQSRRRRRRGVDVDDDDRLPQTASARNDAVTRYMSTTRGRLSLIASSGIVGAMMGAFLGKSILGRGQELAVAVAAIFIACCLLRNPYGELTRALGLALVLSFQRTAGIRRQYPGWPHVKASIRMGQRQRFPPALGDQKYNPWNYQPEYEDDVDFQMMYTVVAMTMVGATIGGNIPLVPTWIGSIAGAVSSAYTTTLDDPRGDLTRSMGMRVVALVKEVLQINGELRLVNKAGVVSGKILDKCLILDRKHRIKDRLVVAFQWIYDHVSRQANQVQSDMQQQQGPREDDGDNSRRSRDRRRDDDDGPTSGRDDRRGPRGRGRRPPVPDDDDGNSRYYSADDRSSRGRRPPPTNSRDRDRDDARRRDGGDDDRRGDRSRGWSR